MRSGARITVRNVLLSFLAAPSLLAAAQTVKTATLTIGGAEQSINGVWDSGNLTIDFNGYMEIVHYGQYSSPAALASAVGAMFTRDYYQFGLWAKAGANQDPTVVTFQLVNGSNFGPLTITGPTNSFSLAPSGFGSANPIADTGTVTLQVAGTTIASAAYAATSTPATVARDLAAASTASSLVKVVAGGSNLYLQAKQTGAASNYSYTVSATSSNPTAFPTPSFFGTAVSGTLTGGADQNSQGGLVYSYNVANSSNASGYDLSGNLIDVSDSVMGTWHYSYDSLSRLTTGSATGGPYGGKFFCWGYDSFGNRQHQALSNQAFPSTNQASCQAASGASVTDNWANYTANDNHITSNVQLTGGVAGNAATWPGNGIYDLAGNVINDGAYTYLYDADGRICAVHGAQGLIGYQYDADGNRVGKGTITKWSCDLTANGYIPSNEYVLDQSGGQMAEISINGDGTSNWQHTNVMANGMLIATYDTAGYHFYLNDPLGTRRVQTDLAGVPEQNCQSLPFGDQLNCTQNLVAPTEHHFTGKERDTESGLDYFGARYYASNMGRWMSPDWADKPEAVPYSQLDNPQSLNLYGYVNNNPLSRVDEDGHCFWDLCIGEGAATYAAGAALVGLTVFEVHKFSSYISSAQGQADIRGVKQSISNVLHSSNADESTPAPAGTPAPDATPTATGQQVPTAAPGFVGDAGGNVVKIPEGSTARPADNGNGVVYQPPVAAGQHPDANAVRVMGPHTNTPTGSITVHGPTGQPINPATGRPDTRANTHTPIISSQPNQQL